MGESTSLEKIAFLLAAMAALAVLEVWLPLRQIGPRAPRWRPNLALTLIYLLMNLVLTAGLLGMLSWMEQRGPGLLRLPGLPAFAAFVLGFVALDFCAYAVHVLMHKTPWLWRIHSVHHSDPGVDVTTAFRQHPLEGLLRFLFTSIPAALLGVSPDAAATYRLVSGLNALLEHSNLRVAARLDRGLRWLLVTPHMHKAHHSRLPIETDSNYGNILSVFDSGLGTYTPTERANQVRYGLDEIDREQSVSFSTLLKLPWRQRPSADAASVQL